MRSSKTQFMACTASAMIVAVAPAHAQTAPVATTARPAAPNAEATSNGGLQDIVVTARRQSESLQKTPISITALNAQALEKINVQSIDKVAQVAPNLIISQQSSALSSASAWRCHPRPSHWR